LASGAQQPAVENDWMRHVEQVSSGG
jgi:hypothetical protein